MKYLQMFALLLVATHANAKYWCENPQNEREGFWADTCPETMLIRSKPPKGLFPEVNPFAWQPQIGMAEEDAQAAVDLGMSCIEDSCTRQRSASAGWIFVERPRINRTRDASGVHDQWVFSWSPSNKYLYFDNGVLTSIQE